MKSWKCLSLYILTSTQKKKKKTSSQSKNLILEELKGEDWSRKLLTAWRLNQASWYSYPNCLIFFIFEYYGT